MRELERLGPSGHGGVRVACKTVPSLIRHVGYDPRWLRPGFWAMSVGKGQAPPDSSTGKDATNHRTVRPSTSPVRSPGSSRRSGGRQRELRRGPHSVAGGLRSGRRWLRFGAEVGGVWGARYRVLSR